VHVNRKAQKPVSLTYAEKVGTKTGALSLMKIEKECKVASIIQKA
jgi:hypothetical protein